MTPCSDWWFTSHGLSLLPYDLFLSWSICLWSPQWLIADLCTILFFFFFPVWSYYWDCITAKCHNYIPFFYTFVYWLTFVDLNSFFHLFFPSFLLSFLFSFFSCFLHTCLPPFFYLTSIYEVNCIKTLLGVIRVFPNANGQYDLYFNTCKHFGYLTMCWRINVKFYADSDQKLLSLNAVKKHKAENGR